jgi:hypothetical protein
MVVVDHSGCFRNSIGDKRGSCVDGYIVGQQLRGTTMQTKTKLVLLELTSGIFGWAWIIASLAAIYLLIKAIFFDGLWSNFFWAVGIGAVGKWLCRGFQDSQARVAFEQKLIAEGHTPEQARAEWVRRYSQQ